MYKFTEQCTIWLQMESLIKCAKGLGYEFNGRAFWTIKDIGLKDKRKYFLSFMDMQIIHNTSTYDSTTLPLQPKLPWSYEGYVKVVPLGSKIVEESYLQYNKKLKCFQTTKNMVRFV